MLSMFMKNSVVIALFMLSLFLNPVIGKEFTTISVDANEQKELLLSEIAKEIKVVNVESDDIRDNGVLQVFNWDKNVMLVLSKNDVNLYLYNAKKKESNYLCQSYIESIDYQSCHQFHTVNFKGNKVLVSMGSNRFAEYTKRGKLKNITEVSQLYDNGKTRTYFHYPISHNRFVAVNRKITDEKIFHIGGGELFDYLNEHTLVTTNKQGDLVRHVLPTTTDDFSFPTHSTTSIVNNKVYLHYNQTDTIYCVNANNGEISIGYAFDFGENSFPDMYRLSEFDRSKMIGPNNSYTYSGAPNNVYVGKENILFQFSQRGYVNTGVYNIESGQIKNGILTNDLFEGRDIKLVGSDDHYFIFVAEVPPKKKYSESLYNMLREQGFDIKVEGMQKDDRQEFTVSDKAAGYMSESDFATLSNAQEKDVILLFVKVK